MKKMFTLLFTVGIISTAFAQGNYQRNQYGPHDQYTTSSNGYGRYYDGRYYNNRNYSYKEQRAFQIQRVQQDYERRIMMIENNRFMRRHEKKLAIRNAKMERDIQIRRINAQYERTYQNWRR